MARPQKKGLDYFPQTRTYNRLKKNKKYYRNSSSGYIKKPAVREYIFKKNNYKCVYCNSKQNLSIDHIIPVLYGFNNNINLFVINHIDNLQTLCYKCNSQKPGDKLPKGVLLYG